MPSYAPTMTDVPARLGRPAIVAIAFAVVALLTSVIAVIVVMRRDRAPAPAQASAPTTIEHAPLASDVVKLKRDVVEKVTDDRGNVIGVKLEDETLRAALGLEPGDVITALNGRTIKREFDIYDAVLGTSMMDASIVYVEITRAEQPRLVRWKLDGDLRTARHDSKTTLYGTTNPFVKPRDPLIETITKIDNLHFEVPRATVERFAANPDPYARQARIVPAPAADGYRLYAVSPNSVFAALGLQSGDTIRSVNGGNPEEIFQHKDATELRIVVERRNRVQQTLVVTIK